MRNVLLIISNLEYGGAQRQVVELANNFDKNKYNVHVCSLSNYIPLAEELSDKTHLHIIHKYHKFDLTTVIRLVFLVKKLRINVVVSYLFDANFVARLAGRFSKRCVVINSERNANYKIKNIQYKAYHATKNYVDGFIANSQSGADFSSVELGHSVSMYDVVYNGVNVERYKPINNKEIRKSIGLKKDDFVIGMFASLKEQKNHPFFLKVIRELQLKNIRFKVLFVGDMLYGGMHGSDDYAEKIINEIKNTRLKECCFVLGNREDLPELYNACDVTVLPSLYEGTPNVILESMACGIPVIATNVSDNAKIISSGVDGFIIELGDDKGFSKIIEGLVKDRQEARRVGKNSRKLMINNYSTKKLAENTGLVIDKYFDI